MATFIKIYQDNPNPRDIAKVVTDYKKRWFGNLPK